MAPLVVLVELVVKPDFAERFGDLVLANAQASLEREAGCRRFDVLLKPEEPGCIVLYEIYDDDGAFDLHLESRHYKTFARAIEGQVEERMVRRLRFLGPSRRSSGKAEHGRKAKKTTEEA